MNGDQVITLKCRLCGDRTREYVISKERWEQLQVLRHPFRGTDLCDRCAVAKGVAKLEVIDNGIPTP